MCLKTLVVCIEHRQDDAHGGGHHDKLGWHEPREEVSVAVGTGATVNIIVWSHCNLEHRPHMGSYGILPRVGMVLIAFQ